ncbi:MAG: hypothetical protein ABI625_07595 [bacterium]
MMRRMLALAAVGLAVVTASAFGQRPDSAFVGAWEGSAHITVDWTPQTELFVRIIIREDGGVTGTIGDANLTDARFFDNRGFLARSIRFAPNWIIEGRLSGFIIRAEDIRRESVRISVARKADTFEGSLSTSGTNDGGKDSMKLTASGLVLRRTLPVILSTQARIQ